MRTHRLLTTLLSGGAATTYTISGTVYDSDGTTAGRAFCENLEQAQNSRNQNECQPDWGKSNKAHAEVGRHEPKLCFMRRGQP